MMAPDAIRIDTTSMPVMEVVDRVLAIVRERSRAWEFVEADLGPPAS